MFGIQCVSTLDACAESPCFDGVACTSLDAGAFSCAECPAGYAGDGTVCDEIDDCEEMPCGEKGACTDTGTNSYTCVCNDGYFFTGGTCMIENNCSDDDSNECDFNADCEFFGPGLHTCTCMVGYEGDGDRFAAGCVDVDGCAETVYDDAPCFAGCASRRVLGKVEVFSGAMQTARFIKDLTSPCVFRSLGAPARHGQSLPGRACHAAELRGAEPFRVAAAPTWSRRARATPVAPARVATAGTAPPASTWTTARMRRAATTGHASTPAPTRTPATAPTGALAPAPPRPPPSPERHHSPKKTN